MKLRRVEQDECIQDGDLLYNADGITRSPSGALHREAPTTETPKDWPLYVFMRPLPLTLNEEYLEKFKKGEKP